MARSEKHGELVVVVMVKPSCRECCARSRIWLARRFGPGVSGRLRGFTQLNYLIIPQDGPTPPGRNVGTAKF